MTWLTALVPVKDGVAMYAALTRSADCARAAGDPRSKGQVMADTLVESVVSAAAARRDAQTRWDAEPEPEKSEGTPRTGVVVGLVMSDQSLFGRGDEPSFLEGYGSVPADLAREIVRGACDRGERVWLRRLYAHPSTGELVAMDSRSRFFRGSLARFIQLRDQTCRTPWCDAPIRHRDHALGHDEAGETSAENAQGLCEACNLAKQAAGWRARPSPASAEGKHRIRTRTPTGHAYETGPPPVPGTLGNFTFRVDYARTG
jgi:hypothetical protein